MGHQQGGQSMGMYAMDNSYGGYPGSMSRNGESRTPLWITYI